MSQGPHFILGHILDNLSAGYMTCTGKPEVWYSNPVVRDQWEQNVQQKRVFGAYRDADNSYRLVEDVDTSSFKRQLFAELEASASFPSEDNYPGVTFLDGDQITSQAINAASGGVLVLRGALVHIPYDAVFSGLLIVESSNVEIGGGAGPYLTGKMLLIAGEHAFDDVVRIAINTGEVTTQAPFELEPRECDIYIAYRSFLQIYMTHRDLTSDYDGYPSRPADHPADRYATLVRIRVNPTSVSYDFYRYSKRADVEGVENLRSWNDARNFMASATEEPDTYVSRIGTPINKVVATGTIHSQFSFSYQDLNYKGEIITQSRNITNVAVYVSGGFIYKRWNIQYDNISLTDSSLQVSFTDSGSATQGMFSDGEGSKLWFSEALTGTADYSASANLTLGDFPEQLQYKGRTYIPARFLAYAHSAPGSGNDIYVEYIREDRVADPP